MGQVRAVWHQALAFVKRGEIANLLVSFVRSCNSIYRCFALDLKSSLSIFFDFCLAGGTTCCDEKCDDNWLFGARLPPFRGRMSGPDSQATGVRHFPVSETG